MPRRHDASGLLLALALVGCDGALAPTRAVDSAPFIESIGIDFSLYRDGGVFSLYGSPFDPSFRLPAGAYVPVEVSTSRGDAELLRLLPMHCGETLCNLINIEMRSGASVLDFEQAIRAAGGRLAVASTAWDRPHSGVVWALDLNPERVAFELFNHPAVASVERQERFFWMMRDDAALRGGIALADEPVRPSDGTLSLAPGDTIFVRYTTGDVVTLRQWVHYGFNTP